MTTVVISQPMYFAWPGFFELVKAADVYVHLDDVQFSRGGFTNRIQIKHQTGIKWMTIPLAGKGSFQAIKELRSSDPGWRVAHRTALTQSLAGAPFLDRALDLFDRAVTAEPLARAVARSTDLAADELGIGAGAQRLVASELGVPGTSWRRVLDLVHRVGGTRYVTAHGAARYLEHEVFESEGVTVEYIDYSLTPWPQFHGAFTPYVTVLDLVAQSGPDAGKFVRTRTIPWRVHLERRNVCRT